MKKTKILHILYSGRGGLGSYFMNFVLSDKDNSFDHYAVFYGIEPLETEYMEFCLVHGITYVYLPKKRKIDLKSYRRCNEFIKENGISNILIHTLSMTPIYLRPFRKYTVLVIDHTNYVFKNFIERIFTILNHLFADKMVYFYPQQFANLKKKVPILYSGKNTLYIPKTISTGYFTPRDSPKNHEFKIGMASRLVPGKRHDLLIEAMSIIKKNGVNVVLEILGEGPLMNVYKNKVKELGLDFEIRFLGNYSKNQIVDFYSDLDAYIHATNGETICFSIMEAQSCELPVLASNVDGVNTVLVHGRNAYLFDNMSESIAEAIIELKTNDDDRREMGKKNRLEMVEHHRRHNPVEEILKCIY